MRTSLFKGALHPMLALSLTCLFLPAAAESETNNDGASAPRTAPAEYETVAREYRFDGVVEAVNQTTISAQTQGQLEAIYFDVDNFVDEGDLIAKINDTQHKTRVAQAAADLKSSTARMAQARDEFARIKGLFERKNASASARDQAEAELKGAQAQVEVSQAALEQAQEQLAYTQILAPYAGIVTERHIEVGEIAEPGAPIMTGISLEKLRVTVDVPQGVVPAVRELGEVTVYLPDGEQAEVTKLTVFPYADPGSSTFKVRIDLAEGTQSLFPGMFVKSGIITGKKQELTVPASAVVHRSEVTGVYLVGDDDALSFVQIRAGRKHGQRIVVLSGLSEGEQVALDPVAAGAALRAQIADRTAARAETHGG